MNYLLDTCVISELVSKQPNQKVIDWLATQIPETLYLDVITIGEIAKGVSKLPFFQRKEELGKGLYWHGSNHYKSLECFTFDL